MRNRLAIAFLYSVLAPLVAGDTSRDFSGDWILMYERSNIRALGSDPEAFLTVAQDASSVRCSSTVGGESAEWSYRLDGADSRYRLNQETRNSAVKWEGAALLVNTLVSGQHNYTVMDRWTLSPDRSLLTITRQIVRPSGEVEGTLVYRRAGASIPPVTPSRQPAPPAAVSAPRRTAAPPPVLQPRPSPPPPAPGDVVVPAGTHVLLELVNSLNTRQSRDGDRVYLRTAVPVAVHDRVVIPRGAAVAGTVVEARQPGKGRGDLYIRFDSLTLPNGVNCDLRSRPESGSEGKLAGAPDHSGDMRKVGEGAGIGAAGGSLAGVAAGHPGIGAGVGAAAGLAAVLTRKNAGVTLSKGTTVDMALDRDLHFTWEELRPATVP